MTVHQYLRLIAGAFVLGSVALGYFVSPLWLLFTGFVGLNLLQSAFSDWCPMMTILRKAGARECRHEEQGGKVKSATV
jgi:H+/gluconate symporter-like permease